MRAKARSSSSISGHPGASRAGARFHGSTKCRQKCRDRGLVIIGVNGDTSEADVVEFLKEFPVHFKTIRDDDGSLARDFDVVAMPSSYVLDRDGTVVARHLGFKVRMTDDYEAVIRNALAGSEAGAELISAAQLKQ